MDGVLAASFAFGSASFCHKQPHRLGTDLRHTVRDCGSRIPDADLIKNLCRGSARPPAQSKWLRLTSGVHNSVLR